MHKQKSGQQKEQLRMKQVFQNYPTMIPITLVVTILGIMRTVKQQKRQRNGTSVSVMISEVIGLVHCLKTLISGNIFASPSPHQSKHLTITPNPDHHKQKCAKLSPHNQMNPFKTIQTPTLSPLISTKNSMTQARYILNCLKPSTDSSIT